MSGQTKINIQYISEIYANFPMFCLFKNTAFYAHWKILLGWKLLTPPMVSGWKAAINGPLLLYKLTYASRNCPAKFDKIWNSWIDAYGLTICYTSVQMLFLMFPEYRIFPCDIFIPPPQFLLPLPSPPMPWTWYTGCGCTLFLVFAFVHTWQCCHFYSACTSL